MDKHQLLGDWNMMKEELHNAPNDKLRPIRNVEIWWVGIGENVGIEINGKSEYFSRLYSRIGQVPDSDLELVRDGFWHYMQNKYPLAL